MSQIRKLKINTMVRFRTWDRTTYPQIRIEGKWLEKLGFMQGQTVCIEQKKNKLIITIDKGQK